MMNFLAQIGQITRPDIAVDPGNPETVIAGIIRNGISLLLIAAFVIALIWTILAGLSFIFAGGDEKGVASAWSRIYWGLIGMVVVVGSFAIIKLVETFFGISVLSGEFHLTSP